MFRNEKRGRKPKTKIYGFIIFVIFRAVASCLHNRTKSERKTNEKKIVLRSLFVLYITC